MVSDKEIIYKEYLNMKKDIQNNLVQLNKKLSIEVYSSKYNYLFFHARSTFDTLYAFNTEVMTILDDMMEKAIAIHRKELDFEETRLELTEKIADKWLYPHIDKSKEPNLN